LRCDVVESERWTHDLGLIDQPVRRMHRQRAGAQLASLIRYQGRGREEDLFFSMTPTVQRWGKSVVRLNERFALLPGLLTRPVAEMADEDLGRCVWSSRSPPAVRTAGISTGPSCCLSSTGPGRFNRFKRTNCFPWRTRTPSRSIRSIKCVIIGLEQPIISANCS